MIHFSLFGIPVSIKPLMWISLALLGASIADPGREGGLLYMLLFVIAGFITLLTHEMGHALVGRRLGGGYHRITLFMFGGETESSGARFTKWTRIATVFAGPFATMLLFLLMSIIIFILVKHPLASLQTIISLTFNPIAGANTLIILMGFILNLCLFWTILNLLPIIPLDGGQIMAEFIRSPRKAHTASYLIALVFAGLTFYFFGFNLLLLFMGLFAYTNYKASKNAPF